MSQIIRVQNSSGQVVSFDVTGPADPRALVLEQRIARGEFARVDDDITSTVYNARTVLVHEDEHTGLRDEAGNLLKSVHGGGLDPDAAGDVLGQPSGTVPADELGEGYVAVTSYRDGQFTPEELHAQAVAQDEDGDVEELLDSGAGEQAAEGTTKGEADGDAAGPTPVTEATEEKPAKPARTSARSTSSK